MIQARNKPIRTGRSERGIVLATALVFLVALSLVGISSMRSATMQERMAGNSRDRSVAFQMAEETLRHAENDILDEDIATKSYAYKAGKAPDPRSIGSCSNLRTVKLNDFKASDLANSNPCYFVEILDTELDGTLEAGDTPGNKLNKVAVTLYRITAYGYGTSDDTRVILQSVSAGASASGSPPSDDGGGDGEDDDGGNNDNNGNNGKGKGSGGSNNNSKGSA